MESKITGDTLAALRLAYDELSRWSDIMFRSGSASSEARGHCAKESALRQASILFSDTAESLAGVVDELTFAELEWKDSSRFYLLAGQRELGPASTDALDEALNKAGMVLRECYFAIEARDDPPADEAVRVIRILLDASTDSLFNTMNFCSALARQLESMGLVEKKA